MVIKSNPGRAARLAIAMIVMAFSAGLALTAGHAKAQTAAGTDALLRPDFGLLLQPPIRRHWPEQPYWGGHTGCFQGCQQGGGYAVGPLLPIGRRGSYHLPVVTVDCADTRWGPNPLQYVIDNVVDDGGTIYIKRGGPACVGSLRIWRSVKIEVETASAFSGEPEAAPAVIEADPRIPCVSIMPPPGSGIRVELHDVVIRTQHGGDAPCIVAKDADVALIHSKVAYQGEASAVAVLGGWIRAADSEIVTRGYDPALTTEHASVELNRVKIVAPESGVDISPLANGATSLLHVTVRAGPGDDPTIRPEVGVFMRLARDPTSPAAVTIRNTKVVGFDTGMGFQHGLHVEVNTAKILGARIGVSSEANGLSLTDSIVGASHAGVNVISGDATIHDNWIFGFEVTPIERESDARFADRGRGDVRGPGDGHGVRIDDRREGSWGDPDLANVIYPRDPHECDGRFRAFGYWCRFDPPGFIFVDDDQPGMMPGWDGEPFRAPEPPRCFTVYEGFIFRHPVTRCDGPGGDHPWGPRDQHDFHAIGIGITAYQAGHAGP